jgi:hypothetical protein
MNVPESRSPPVVPWKDTSTPPSATTPSRTAVAMALNSPAMPPVPCQ